MKKIIFVTTLIISMLLQVYAQDEAQDKKLKFGVKVGLNFANNVGNGLGVFLENRNEKANTRKGFTIGGTLEYKLSDKFFLQPELLYSQQGFKKKYSQYEIKIKLDYINIPVMVKYYAMDRLSLEFGPQLGFLVSSKSLEKDNNDEYEADLKEFFKSTDFGLNFGAGYQLENGIGINARYILGLADIFDYSFGGGNEDKNPTKSANINTKSASNQFVLKNRVLNISLFYTF